MSLVNIVLGAFVLFFGRSLYWIFVAAAGFMLGVEWAQEALADQASWVRILVAAVAGLIGAGVAAIAQRIGFAIAGFFAGGLFATLLAQHAALQGDPHGWMLAGGTVGALLCALLMDWAIVVLSSVAGAAAICGSLELEPEARLLVFVVCLVLGLGFQCASMRRSRSDRPAGAMRHGSTGRAERRRA